MTTTKTETPMARLARLADAADAAPSCGCGDAAHALRPCPNEECSSSMPIGSTTCPTCGAHAPITDADVIQEIMIEQAAEVAFGAITAADAIAAIRAELGRDMTAEERRWFLGDVATGCEIAEATDPETIAWFDAAKAGAR